MDPERVPKVVMEEAALREGVRSLAQKILEANPDPERLALVGIVRRGALLATMIAQELQAATGVAVPVGSLDISFYRDDVTRHIHPVLHATDIPFAIDGIDVVLVDDVLFTGRTIRSALNAINDLGRPDSIRLAVLVDRGHRELPICADYVAITLPSTKGDDVRVLVGPEDGRYGIEVWDSKDKEGR